MSLHKNWKTDSKKELDGVSIEFEANDNGTIPTFIISRMGGEANKEYSKAVEAAAKPYRRQIDLKTVSPDVVKKIMLEVFVSSVLRGWSNIEDENGVVLEFNKENAIKLFNDLPELYTELQSQAQNIALFRADALEKEAKN